MSVFNGLVVRREEDGIEKTPFRVPIYPGVRDTIFDRVKRAENIAHALAEIVGEPISLPLLACSMTGWTQRSEDRSGLFEQTVQAEVYDESGNLTGYKVAYTPSPWTFEYEISVWTKFYEDYLQIMEQILPFFDTPPSLQISLDSVGLIHEVPIRMTSSSVSVPVADDIEREKLNAMEPVSLTFEAEGYLFKPVHTKTPIQQVTVDMKSYTGDEDETNGGIRGVVIGTLDDALNITVSKTLSDL